MGLDNCDNLRGGLQRLLLRCSVNNEESGLDLDVLPLITDEPLIPEKSFLLTFPGQIKVQYVFFQLLFSVAIFFEDFQMLLLWFSS